jgi:hypothetical protein
MPQGRRGKRVVAPSQRPHILRSGTNHISAATQRRRSNDRQRRVGRVCLFRAPPRLSSDALQELRPVCRYGSLVARFPQLSTAYAVIISLRRKSSNPPLDPRRRVRCADHLLAVSREWRRLTRFLVKPQADVSRLRTPARSASCAVGFRPSVRLRRPRRPLRK